MLKTGILFVAIFSMVRGDMESAFTQTIESCRNKVPVSREELELLQRNQVPDTAPAKCLLFCIFRESGFMNAGGMLSAEEAMRLTQLYYPGDSEKIEKTQKYLDRCGKVNELPFTGDNAACERAAVLFKCVGEFKQTETQN